MLAGNGRKPIGAGDALSLGRVLDLGRPSLMPVSGALVMKRDDFFRSKHLQPSFVRRGAQPPQADRSVSVAIRIAPRTATCPALTPSRS